MSPLDRLRWLELVAEKMRGDPLAFAVAFALLKHRNTKTGRCDPSIGRIARRVGRGVTATREAVKKLEGADLIAVDRHQSSSGGRPSDYKFVVAEAGVTPPEIRRGNNGSTPPAGRRVPLRKTAKNPSGQPAHNSVKNSGATPPLEAGGEHKKDNPQSPEQIARNREKLAELRKTIGRPDNG